MPLIKYQRFCQGCKNTKGDFYFIDYVDYPDEHDFLVINNDDFLFDFSGNIIVTEAAMIRYILKFLHHTNEKCDFCGMSNKWSIWDVWLDSTLLRNIGGYELQQYFSLIEKADELMWNGDNMQATDVYLKAIELNKEYPEPYFFLGILKARTSGVTFDYSYFNTAIRLNPFYTDAYINRGVIKKVNKDWSSAKNDFDKAIELNAIDDLAFFHRGDTRMYLKDYNGAIYDLNKVVELGKPNDEVFLRLGEAFFAIRNFNKALENYNKAIQVNPECKKAYYYRGNLKKEINDFAGSVIDYDKVISLDEWDEDAYNSRGNVKRIIKDFNGAIGDYNKAIRINPNFKTAIINLHIAQSESL